jgi:hypothetical protein
VKKILLSIVVGLLFVFNVAALISSNSFSVIFADVGGGSSLDCYSTFQTSGSGDQYSVTDCGPCKTKLYYGYSDKGTCRKPRPSGGGGIF